MEETKGFYKFEDGILYHAKFGLSGRDFELLPELHHTYTYPVEGWYWFDHNYQARMFFNFWSDYYVGWGDLATRFQELTTLFHNLTSSPKGYLVFFRLATLCAYPTGWKGQDDCLLKFWELADIAVSETETTDFNNLADEVDVPIRIVNGKLQA